MQKVIALMMLKNKKPFCKLVFAKKILSFSMLVIYWPAHWLV